MDEFSIFLDLDLFSRQDPLALQLFGSGAVRPVFDVVLSALSDGTLLRPHLFFRGCSSNVPEGFPDNILLEARQDGFTDRDRLRIWTDKVCENRVRERAAGWEGSRVTHVCLSAGVAPSCVLSA